jgi:tetratricopeptide (TPR) repeat protein
MDVEGLQTLQSIKTLMQIFVVIAFLNFCVGCIRLKFRVKEHYWTAFNTVFQLQCVEYFDQGKFDDLVKHCEQRLAERPRDAYALLFLGKAYAAQHEYSKAKTALTKLLSLEPKWGQEYGQSTLDEIADAEKRANTTPPKI